VEAPVIIEEIFEPEEQNTTYQLLIEEKVATDGEAVNLTDEDLSARVQIGLTEESVEQMLKQQKGRYHFDRLNAAEQQLYVELLKVMEEYGSGIAISTIDTDSIEKVFQCVLNDHPGIFYVVGYRYTKYSLEDVTKKITFTATYSYGMTETKNRQIKIDAYVDRCLREMPSGADDYQKVKYIYEYLINNTEYDAMAEDNQNICSVFLRGRSVCQGYAKATQYLLNETGIPATLIMGKVVVGGEGHAWNIVLLDGDYYHVDTTFGDASYISEGNNEASGTANIWNNTIWPINYDYLCVTTAQIEKTHKLSPIVPLAECIATKNNYFIREGLYFTTVDEEKLQALFNREYERGNSYITIKCADYRVFMEMMDYLIEQQNIFRFLAEHEGIIRYVEMEEQLNISFWL
jgi:transglutaminase-like putative cysteine protease